MKYSTKISVIVPVYNTEKYLRKCLDSLVAQTLREIEIVVVNDGSPDRSQTIIDEFVAKDKRVKSYQKPNGGLSDARNFGIEKATGKYLAFVDSDDFVDAEMMQTLYSLAEKHQAEIAFCDLVKVNEKGEEFRELQQSPQLAEKIVLAEDFTLFGEMSCFACNKIFDRKLFDQHRFALGKHFEDIELIPKLVLDSTTIAKINQPFYKYFEREDSITKTHTEKGLDMFWAIEQVTKYFYESPYAKHKEDLERFQIFQGYYSYLGYVAYIKDRALKSKMIDELVIFLKKYHLEVNKIKHLQRFGKNYIVSLPLKKWLYYQLSFFNLNLLKKI
ncbi:glycosyltransferase [Weeksella virosa]|uniref:glycosyltransferase family 2 protein n=1 Tax=Weeksella virosa TaxID=1014 RepID=UPI002554E874|nr:glycosyltransferase [Weeksella virosa]MDK7374453.1 glycosyltransferase [Weeksella virosa]